MSDDDVGYGKPPRHNQFKKGQSGNPKGRPKGAKNLKTVVNQELLATVVLKEGGTPKSVTKIEGIVKSAVTNALLGDPKALAQVLSLAKEYMPEEVDATSGSAGLPPGGLDVLNSYAHFLSILEGSDDDSDDQENPS
jgi:hypothetical protein